MDPHPTTSGNNAQYSRSSLTPGNQTQNHRTKEESCSQSHSGTSGSYSSSNDKHYESRRLPPAVPSLLPQDVNRSNIRSFSGTAIPVEPVQQALHPPPPKILPPVGRQMHTSEQIGGEAGPNLRLPSIQELVGQPSMPPKQKSSMHPVPMPSQQPAPLATTRTQQINAPRASTEELQTSSEQTSEKSKPAGSKSQWSKADDEKLKSLVGQGLSWRDIAKHFQGRTYLSCRLRYQNYLESPRQKQKVTIGDADGAC